MSFAEQPSSDQVLARIRRASPETKNTAPQRAIPIGILAYAVALTVLTLSHPFSDFAFLAITDVAGCLPPLFAGLLALLAAERSIPQVRLAWRLIGSACLAWGLGEVTWTVYEVILRQEIPFPSLADAGYLAMLPLMTLGLVCLSADERKLAHSTPTLDGVAVVLALSAFVWFFILHPTYSESSAGLLEKAIGVAYPVGDLVLAYALMVGVRRQWGYRESLVLALLLAGVFLFIAADVGFAYETLNETYSATSAVNLGWPFGFLCMAYAAALSANWTLAFEDSGGVARPTAWPALPLFFLPPLVGLVFISLRDQSIVTSVPVAVMAAIAALAVLIRVTIAEGLFDQFEISRERALYWLDDWWNRKAA